MAETRINIQKFEGILLQHDLECEGSIATRHGLFLGNLFLTDRHGFKVFKRKEEQLPQKVREFMTDDVYFTAEDAVSCVDWYRKLLFQGFVTSIEEVFPQEYLYKDFDEVDFSADVQALTERLNLLDTVNMLDAEFVTALQAGGDAYAEIASQVLTETQRATVAEQGITSAYIAADGVLVGSASVSGNTLEKLETRLASQESTFSDIDIAGAILNTKKRFD